MKNEREREREREMLYSQHFSQQILSGKLLLVVIGRKKKSNFSGGFKLELVTT